jgi:hypothetical protein
MPSNRDTARLYRANQDRIETREAHGEQSLDKALGVTPKAQPKPKTAAQPATKPGKGGLAHAEANTAADVAGLEEDAG